MLLSVFPKGKKTERAAEKDPCFGQRSSVFPHVDTNTVLKRVFVGESLAELNFIKHLLANSLVIDLDNKGGYCSDWQREHKARETKEGGVTKSIENFHAPMMATGG